MSSAYQTQCKLSLKRSLELEGHTLDVLTNYETCPIYLHRYSHPYDDVMPIANCIPRSLAFRFGISVSSKRLVESVKKNSFGLVCDATSEQERNRTQVNECMMQTKALV